MQKSFESLWDAMETRRQHIKAAAVQAAYPPEHLRREQRRARGCPDGEALCGWVDGQLRRTNWRRWFSVCRHVWLQSCPVCREEIAMLAEGAGLSDEVQRSHQRRSAWPRAALTRARASLLPGHLPLAWVGGTLLASVGFSIWLISQHGIRDIDGYHMVFPRIEEGRDRPQPSSEPTTDSHAARPIIWGD
jgi:hypothetical protein